MSPPDPTKVKIFPVVLSYPYLFERRKPSADNDDTSYGAELYVYQNNPKFQQILNTLQQAANAAIQMEWGSNVPQFRNAYLRDLAEKNKPDKPPLPPGLWIRTKSDYQPSVVKRDPNAPPGAYTLVPVTDPNEVYPGIIVAAEVKANAYRIPAKNANGVNWYLNHIVLLADGERLGGGGRDPDEVFGDYLNEFSQYQLTSPQERLVQQAAQMPGQYGQQAPPQGMPGQYGQQAPPPQGMPGQYGQQAPPQGMPQQYGQQAPPPQGMPGQYGQQAPPQGVPQQYGQQAPPQGMPGQYGQQAPPQGQPPGFTLPPGMPQNVYIPGVNNPNVPY